MPVFKQKRANGKESKTYSCSVWIKGKKTTRSLRTTHKDRAEQRERELLQVIELQEMGRPVPSHLFGAPSRSIAEYLKEYENSLRSRDFKAKHVHDTVTRIETLCRACKWSELEDISPITFERWRSGVPRCERTGRTLGGKTIVEYLTSIRAFLNWLKRQGIVEKNVLEHVEKGDIRGTERKKRRVWTDEDLERFMQYGKPPKRADYRLAVWILRWTGLRKNELATLRWGDLHLDAESPFLIVRSGVSKNRKNERVPLMGKVSAKLHSIRSDNWTTETKVLPFKIPGSEQLKADLKRAGVVYRNDFGDLDFHALRYTFGHWLASNGVPLLTIQSILRHSDPSTTARHYMNVAGLSMNKTLEEVFKASDAAEKCTPNCTPLTVPEGLSQSQPVTNKGVLGNIQEIVNEAVSRALAPYVTQGLSTPNGWPNTCEKAN